ncbi:MAG: hypothetical protein CFE44_09075 [Burkholderiales bacterium PBB4]|nr:MAG: hypothetical protein CFE44_09075 [Burkholderiales bacterium PBB4]
MTLKNGSWGAVWVGLLCVAWLQPNHFPPWVSFHSELLTFVAIAILFVICVARRTHAELIQVPKTAIPVLLLLGMTLVQVCIGITDYFGDAVIFVIYMLAMVFALVAGRYGTGDGRIELLAWGILVAGMGSVLIAFLQSFHFAETFPFVNPMPSWRRPGANLAQPNHLGTLLLWAIASAIYLHISKKIGGLLACVLGGVLLVGVAMTESRTALLGVFALAVWAGLGHAEGLNLRRVLFSVVAAGVGGLLFALWPHFLSEFQEAGLSVGSASVNTQAGERYIVWPQLMSAVMERPWLGWGPRGVSVAHNAVLDRYAESAPFTYAHNIVLDVAIGFGLPLTLLLVVLVGVWCARRLRHVRGASDWYAFALLIPFGLHSMLEFPFAYAYFLLPACFAIGMLDAGRANCVAIQVSRGVTIALGVAWILVGAVSVRDYLLAEEDFRIARFEALRMGKTAENYERPRLLVLTQLEAMNNATRVVPTPGMSIDAIESLRTAALHYPWTAIQNRYAQALALNGNIPEAQRQLKVIRAMHGEKVYAAVLLQWQTKAEDKYPQLREFTNR